MPEFKPVPPETVALDALRDKVLIIFFTAILIASLAYVLGSVSPGWIAGRVRGLDLRFEGQETLSFMNAMTVLGKPVGVMVFAADFFKGYLAVGTALLFTNSIWMGVLAGLAAVAGQIWPLFHDFSGGRGGATAAGVLAAASPWTLAISVTLLALLAAVIGRKEHAEVLTIALLPGIVFLTEQGDLAQISLTLMLAALLMIPRWKSVEVILGARKEN